MFTRQMLILVDEHDIPTGEYADKGECHFGDGLHHRAFVVLLENRKGEVLLQFRKHVRWDQYWDLTAISHVLHFDNGDETYEQAANRSLNDEMGIDGIVLENIGGFNYFAKYHSHCENEYCAILIGKYDGDIRPNPDVIYKHKWMAEKDFINDVKTNPGKYTPWAVEAAMIIEKTYDGS